MNRITAGLCAAILLWSAPAYAGWGVLDLIAGRPLVWRANQTVGDDVAWIFGNNSDFKLLYDEATDNRLELVDSAGNIMLHINDESTKSTLTVNGTINVTVTATTVADNGGGTAASGTMNVAGTYHSCTCNDADGCDITLAENKAEHGDLLVITVLTANVCNFADTAGLTELAGAFAGGQYDSISLIYITDRWVEISRSNN